MTNPRPDIDPHAPPEYEPAPDPDFPQPGQPGQPGPRHFPTPDQPGTTPDPAPSPEIPPLPNDIPRPREPNKNEKTDIPVRPAQPQPPMPVHLPTGDAEHPHSSPLRQDIEEDGLDSNLPPEPGHDINP